MTFKRALFGLVALVGATFIASGSYASHGQYYVLDGFGGIHAGGGAPVISPATPYFGFDIAKGIVYVPQGTAASTGDSVLVLDGFGGVHEGGALAADPVFPKTPYFGFDIARAITYRNIGPRAVGVVGPLTGDRTDNNPFTLLSTTIYAPDDGFLVVTGNVQMNCPDTGAAGGVVGQVWINVDSVAVDPNFTNHYAAIDCAASIEGFFPTDNLSPHKVYAVGPGAHTVNFVIKRSAGTKRLRWIEPHLSAVFIDQGANGTSAPEATVPGFDPSRQQ